MSPVTPTCIRPRLLRRTRLAFAGCVAFAVLGGVLLALEPSAWPTSLACIAFFGGLPLIYALFAPQEVQFGRDAFTVYRRIGRPKRIAYADVTGFGIARVQARGGQFDYSRYANAEAFHAAFAELIEAGLIREEQLSSRELGRDLAVQRAALWSIGGALVFIAAALLGWLPRWVDEVPTPVLALAVTLVPLFVAYALLRPR